MIDGWCISGKGDLRWKSLDLSDAKSTLVQVMAWCRQATSHYLSQCWPRSMSPYGVIRPQWAHCDLSHNTPCRFQRWIKWLLFSKLELRACVAVVRTFCSPNSKVTPVSQHCLDNFCELVHERRNSIANALELRLPCTEPKICPIHYFQGVATPIQQH